MMTDYCDCGRIAVWVYMPSHEGPETNDFYCDDCVPRGCSCNMEPKDGDHENSDPSNWEEPLDDKGRKYPCCEFFYLN